MSPSPCARSRGKDVRTGAALARLKPRKWLVPGAQSEALAAAYAEGPAPGRLEDLPETPRFVFLASDMRFRDQWVFDTGKRRVGSSAAGYGPLGTWTLAQAVAASSCVPGAFSVVKAKQEPSSLTGGSYKERDRDKLVREIDLSDGGMFDNLGVEPVWQDHADRPRLRRGPVLQAGTGDRLALERPPPGRHPPRAGDGGAQALARLELPRRAAPGRLLGHRVEAQELPRWSRSTPPTRRISSATSSLRSASTWTSSRRARSGSSRITAT